jgi:hypothetical protein
MSLQLDTLINKTITASVTGVQDTAGNVNPAVINWHFVLKDFGANQASVQINGLKLDVPFGGDLANGSQFMNNITAAIVLFLQVPTSRLSNIVISGSEDGKTLVSFTINPPSLTGLSFFSGSRRDVAQRSASQLAAQLQNGVESGGLFDSIAAVGLMHSVFANNNTQASQFYHSTILHRSRNRLRTLLAMKMHTKISNKVNKN